MIIVFMDLDNWMFIGAFIMLLGMAPISLKLLKKDEYEEDTNVGIGQTTLQNDVPGS